MTTSNTQVSTAMKRPSFGIDTSSMSAEMPLLPNGETWAATITSAGVSEKMPLVLRKEQSWDDSIKKFVDGVDFIIQAPFGFGLGVALDSKQAQRILGRDTPKFFGNLGLTFHKYEEDSEGNPEGLSYTWAGSPAMKELLNSVGLGDENYGELVAANWDDDTEYLMDLLKITPEQRESYEGLSANQLNTAMNAIVYYTEYFQAIAADVKDKKCKAVIAKTPMRQNKAQMENTLYTGTRFAPSSGILKYVENCEFDLED